MSRGRKSFITSLTLLGLSVFLCASPAAEALTVSSEMAAGLDDRAPGPVGDVSAELNLDGTSVTVSWTLADDDFVRQAPAGGDFTSGGVFINVNDVESYGVWRQTVGFGDPELIDEVGAGETSYVDETVITGETYTYLVTAADGSGNQSDAVESGQVNLGPPPTAEVEAPEEIESAQFVQMTFEAELDVEDEEAVEDFASAFIAELALLLGIDPSQITITSITQGSVIVEFTIEGEDAVEAQQELEELVTEDPEILAEVAGTATEYGAITVSELDMGDAEVDGWLLEEFQYTNNSEDPDAILIIAAEVEGDGFELEAESLILANGESGYIPVVFIPSSVGNLQGTYEGVLTIETNDAANRVTVVGLSATISEGLVVGDIVVSGAFNFASVAIGSSKDLALTLANDGDLDLVGSISIEGDPVFSAVGSDEDGNVVQITEVDFSLTGGEEIDITVTFEPIAAESYSGTIVITSDDEDEPEITVELSGSGFDAEEVLVLQDDEGNTILGDFDGNADVNFDDFFIFADNFGQEDFDEATDLDGSGAVNFDDFFIFADNFGKSGTYVGVVASADEEDSGDA